MSMGGATGAGCCTMTGGGGAIGASGGGGGGRESTAISTCSAMSRRSWVLIRARCGSRASPRRCPRWVSTHSSISARVGASGAAGSTGSAGTAVGAPWMVLRAARAARICSRTWGSLSAAAALVSTLRAPRLTAWPEYTGSSWEVHMTTGMWAVERSDLIISNASNPFMPGMVWSMRTASGGASAMRSRAASADSAVSTRTPWRCSCRRRA